MLWNTMKDRSATLDEIDLHEPGSWRITECDSFGLPLLGRLLGYWPLEPSEWESPSVVMPSDDRQ